MPISKQTLEDLYQSKLKSLSEISELSGISIHKVIYWMDKYQIDRRKRSEANYLKHNPFGNPFSIKKRLNLNEIKLKYLALGLYWGEGTKTNRQQIRITNSDPKLLLHFRDFLITICQVNPLKIHYYLQTFKDIPIDKANKYWSNNLNISPALIKCSKPIPPQGKGTYRNISKFGVLTIQVSNIYLREYLFTELKKIGFREKKMIK